MSRESIQTPKAPEAIGPYSQAVRAGKTVYLSGQIALDPASGKLVEGGIDAQIHRAFRNLQAVAEAAGGGLSNAVRLTIYLTDLADFPRVNEIMTHYFKAPYPARATVGVAALPRDARVELDAVLVID
jgi:reactive intermediate/imine deaminase